MKLKLIALFLASLFLHAEAASINDKQFFGENKFFTKIMSGETSEEIIALKRNKEEALEIYKKSLLTSGLELKISASDRINSGFKGYDTSLVWNLFDDGFFGLQKHSNKKALEYGSYYDEVLNNTQSNYLRVAIYEIDDIKDYINAIFNHKKLYYIKKEYRNSKKKLNAGLITRYRYNQIENLYQKASRLPKNDKQKKKVFDKQFETFIQYIEKTTLWEEKELVEKANIYNAILQTQKGKIQALQYTPSWIDDVSASVYISKRKYTFIDREDTLTGVKLSVPLEIKNSDKLTKLNQHILKLKLKSEEALLKKKIHYHYTNFSTHLIEIKEKLSQLKNFVSTTDLEKAQMLEIRQNIWALRCAGLKDLLNLQFLTGVKLFAKNMQDK